MTDLNKLYTLPKHKLLKVGLLGGSFNPPHVGHLHISELALKYIDLDYVVWLISPHNPLKKRNVYQPFDIRVKQCALLVENNEKIIISDYERKICNNYTVKTLISLKKEFPNWNFTWIMGADNLLSLHMWHEWHKLNLYANIAVFDREYSLELVKKSIAVQYFNNIIYTNHKIKLDVHKNHCYFFTSKNLNISSTAIRETLMDYTNSISQSREHAMKLKTDIMEMLDQYKASDIVAIDLQNKADFAHYLVIASGQSSRQIASMAEKLALYLKQEHGMYNLNIAGRENSNWIVIDAIDVIVHLFKPEERHRYNLEKMWEFETDAF